MVEDENGNMIPFSGTIPIRPIPSPDLVQRVRTAMGSGANGVWVGTVFAPGSGPDAFPTSIFAPRHVDTASASVCLRRFVLPRRHVPGIGSLKTMLIFTDGACLDNGSAEHEPRSGWSFVFNDNRNEGLVKGVLEQAGPDSQQHRPTSNRAELRAAIAALEFRAWWGEGWERLVIATDSEYVVDGATTWLRTWAARGWRTSGGSDVQNRDLWEKLSKCMGSLAAGGCEVSFWRIPRELNADADRAAKDAAGSGEVVVKYTAQHGIIWLGGHIGVTQLSQ